MKKRIVNIVELGYGEQVYIRFEDGKKYVLNGSGCWRCFNTANCFGSTDSNESDVICEFVWHKHDNGDEVFLVFEGEFTIQTKEKNFNLKKGECILVPKGVLHCPKADSSATMLVFELKDTKQYGD